MDTHVTFYCNFSWSLNKNHVVSEAWFLLGFISQRSNNQSQSSILRPVQHRHRSEWLMLFWSDLASSVTGGSGFVGILFAGFPSLRHVQLKVKTQLQQLFLLKDEGRLLAQVISSLILNNASSGFSSKEKEFGQYWSFYHSYEIWRLPLKTWVEMWLLTLLMFILTDVFIGEFFRGSRKAPRYLVGSVCVCVCVCAWLGLTLP